MKLVYYDDQSNPATVPGIYTKLLDVDKVNLVVSGYATNMVAPAMPVVIGHNRTFLALFGLAANSGVQLPEIFRARSRLAGRTRRRNWPRVLRRGDAAEPQTHDGRA